jgi:hypothetical protein
LRKKQTAIRKVAGKQWHSIFSTLRLRSNELYYERKREAVRDAYANEYGLAGDNVTVEDTLNEQDLLDEFLGDYEDSIPSWEAKTVRSLFSEYNNQGTVPKSWAWLDERECLSGDRRPWPRVLSLENLREALKNEASRIDALT